MAPVEDVAASQGGPTALALDDQSIYWSNADGSGTIWPIAKAALTEQTPRAYTERSEMPRTTIISRRGLLATAGVSLLAVVTIAACGITGVATGPADGGIILNDTTVDGRDDGPPIDAGPDGDAAAVGDGDADAAAYRCPDNSEVADCSACAGGSVAACPLTGRCLSSCALGCAGRPIACVTCSGGGFTAVCSADKSPGESCAPSKCKCITAAQCPLDTMVCLGVSGGDGNQCFTCGDKDTFDEVCKAGTGAKKCKIGTESKVDSRYLCK